MPSRWRFTSVGSAGLSTPHGPSSSMGQRVPGVSTVAPEPERRPSPEPTDPHPKVVDPMEALQQSVDEARPAPGRPTGRPTSRPDEAEVEDEGYPAAYP